MPRTQPAVENVSRAARAKFREPQALRFAPGQFLISAEHASNHIPARYKNLGLSRRQLQSHIAWDPGSLSIARACAKALGCPCHEGGHSRLLVDLNRSLHHRKLMARESFSIPIPGNADLSREERDQRIRDHYSPFREAVLADVGRIIRARGCCIHLSIHSFTPVVDGAARHGEIGILYDPSRRIEKALASQLIARMGARGFHVRRNFPYRGVSDGHVTGLRKVFSEQKYGGLELEVNQSLLRTEADIRRLARQTAAAVASLAVGA